MKTKILTVLLSFGVCLSVIGQTFRESGGKVFNVTNSTEWELIPKTNWTATVVRVKTDGMLVRLQSGDIKRTVVILNHPNQAKLVRGDVLPRDFYRLSETINGVRFFDFGKPSKTNQPAKNK